MFVETIRDLYSRTKMQAPDIKDTRSTEECKIMNELYEDLKCLTVGDLEQLKGHMYFRMTWFMNNPKLSLDAWSLGIYQINETIRRKKAGNIAWL